MIKNIESGFCNLNQYLEAIKGITLSHQTSNIRIENNHKASFIEITVSYHCECNECKYNDEGETQILFRLEKQIASEN